MEKRTVLERQFLGCGFLPPPPDNLRASVNPWDHHGRKLGGDELDENGKLVTPVCVGYLLRMPEVHEVPAARLHWSKGQLEHWCDGQPTEHLLAAIVECETSINAYEVWRMTPTSKGGGGPG